MSSALAEAANSITSALSRFRLQRDEAALALGAGQGCNALQRLLADEDADLRQMRDWIVGIDPDLPSILARLTEDPTALRWFLSSERQVLRTAGCDPGVVDDVVEASRAVVDGHPPVAVRARQQGFDPEQLVSALTSLRDLACRAARDLAAAVTPPLLQPIPRLGDAGRDLLELMFRIWSGLVGATLMIEDFRALRSGTMAAEGAYESCAIGWRMLKEAALKEREAEA